MTISELEQALTELLEVTDNEAFDHALRAVQRLSSAELDTLYLLGSVTP